MAMKKSKNKATGCAIWLVAAVLVFGAIGSCGSDNDDKDTTAGDSTESTTVTETVDAETGGIDLVDEEPEAEPEPNTSAKVDALALEAKTAVAEGVTDAQRDEAVTFIIDHYPDYYTDNETMEQALTYGFWLEYAYEDDESAQTYAELGMDVSQAVKYVYRGTEAVEDDATQENLRQIQEHLETLGLVKQPTQQEEVAEPTTEATTPVVPPVKQPVEQTVEQPVQSQPSEEMVWIPNTGSKYHSKAGCSNMENPRQVTKSEAESLGFTPCKRCH